MEAENIGALQIEFLINNPEILAELQKTEAAYDSTVVHIEQSANKAGAAVAKLVAKGGFSDSIAEAEAYAASLQGAGDAGRVAASGTSELMKLLNADLEAGVLTAEQFRAEVAAIAQAEEQWAAQAAGATKQQEVQLGVLQELAITLEELKAIKPTLQPGEELNRTNKAIQETEANIVKFNNVGKVGFDEFGQQVKKNVGNSVGFFRQAWSGLRILAQALPGIGIAGILAFATGPIIDYVVALFKGRDAINEFVQRLKAMNEVNLAADKAAAPAISSLKLLYERATDVNLAMDKRIAAAQQLREDNAAEFANSSALSIVNGDLKKSYDELTASILENAKSHAALSKIDDVEKTVMDAQFQIDKNNSIKYQREQKIRAQFAKDLADQANMTPTQIANSGGSLTQADLNLRLAANKQTTDFDNKESAQVIATGNATIKYLTGFVKNVGDKAKQLDDANKLLGKNLENFDSLVKKSQDKADLDNIQSALQTKLKAPGLTDQQIADYGAKLREVEQLEKKYSPKINDGKAQVNAAAEALKEKTGLLQQFDQVQATYRKKDMTDDEAAMQAIADKYNELRAKFIAFNASAKGKLNPVSAGTINRVDQAQTVAEDNQSVLNENKEIEQKIELKKKMYADYEAFRLKVRSETADAQYNDLLKSGKDFGAYLDHVYNSTATIQKKYVGDVSGSVDQLKEFIDKQKAANLETQKQQLNALLDQYASYEQQRAAIVAKGAQDEAILRKNSHNQEADQVHKETQEKLDTLTEEHVKSLDAWKVLFDSAAHLTATQAKSMLSIIKNALDEALKKGDITQTLYDSIIKKANLAYKGITNGLSVDKLIAIGSALQQWSSDISSFNQGLGKAVDTAGKMVSAFASIKGNLNTLGSSNSSSLEKVTAGLGLIGTAVGVVSAVVGLFSKSKEKAEQEQYNIELQQKAVEGVNKALERQLALTKQIYGPERISGYLSSLSQIKTAYDKEFDSIQGKLQLTGDKGLDTQIAKINNGEKVTGFWVKAVYDAQKAGKIFTVAGKSLEDLQKLMDSGKLDSSTAAIVQSLVALQQQAVDTQNALNEEFTGQSFDSLTSGIMQLLQDSTTGVEQWGDNFQKIVQQSILKGFETKYLETQLQAFYTDLANFTKADGGVLSKASIAKLQDEYNTIIKNAQTQIDQIQQATGVTLTNPTAAGSSSNQTLTGAIKGITEDEAGVLSGTTHGIQLKVIEGVDLQKAGNLSMQAILIEQRQQTLIQMKIEANTFRTANNTDKLDNMDKTLTSIDKKMDANTNSLTANGRV